MENTLTEANYTVCAEPTTLPGPRLKKRVADAWRVLLGRSVIEDDEKPRIGFR